MASLLSRMMEWLGERLPIAAARDFASHKTVPVHRYTVFYYLGGMTLFFFVIQVITGILLMLYYRPSAEEAFESIEFIMTTVPFGWLVRSLHAWSAHLMVFFAFIHLVTVYFMKGYRKPREITWVSGVVLLVLAMGFGFSGYLLPWNELAFFATKVGTDIAGAVPLVGEWTVRFLRGGDRVTGGTLSRFYGWHVAILPAITTVVLGLHLLLVQVQGMSVPSWLRRKKEGEKGKKMSGMPFFPHFALRDLFGWTIALGVLAALAAFLPAHLGAKADPFAPAFEGIKPEWYFMFMFETLKLMPGGEVAGIEYEAVPILGFALCGLLLALVPFLDREKPEGEGRGWWILGVVALVYIVGFTAWGYRSLTPILLMAATAALIAFLQYATRHEGS